MKYSCLVAILMALIVAATADDTSTAAKVTDKRRDPEAVLPSAGEARLVFVSDFETGAIQKAKASHDGWSLVNGGLPNATVVVGPEIQTPRSGKYCVQFNLDKDNWKDASPLQGNLAKPRAQLKKPPDILPFVQGVEYWIGISTFHPADWQFDSNTNNQILFWQMHGYRGPQGRSPPLALRLDGRTLSIVNRSGDSKGASFRTENLWQGAMILDQWVDWIVRVRFEQTGTDGYVQVWRNGVLIASKLNAPTLYYTGTPNQVDDQAYQLLSAYKGKWIKEPSSVTHHTMYYDSIRIAEGPDGKDLVDPANY